MLQSCNHASTSYLTIAIMAAGVMGDFEPSDEASRARRAFGISIVTVETERTTTTVSHQDVSSHVCRLSAEASSEAESHPGKSTSYVWTEKGVEQVRAIGSSQYQKLQPGDLLSGDLWANFSKANLVDRMVENGFLCIPAKSQEQTTTLEAAPKIKFVQAPVAPSTSVPAAPEFRLGTSLVGTTTLPGPVITAAPKENSPMAMPFFAGVQNMVGQAGKMVAPAAKQLQKTAADAEKVVVPAAQKLQQKAEKAEKMVAPTAKQFQANAQQALTQAESVVQAKAKPESATTDATAATTTVKNIHREGNLRKGDGEEETAIQKLFTAHKMKLSEVTYDRTLVLGSIVAVAVAMSAILILRLVARQRHQQERHPEEAGSDSGIE
jgi:hypothetical protein